MKDLFGHDEPAPIKGRGHAALPGTGPRGETCGTCKHCARNCVNGKLYRKCGLMRDWWTHGPGTDIRLKDPACKFWEPKAEETDAGYAIQEL